MFRDVLDLPNSTPWYFFFNDRKDVDESMRLYSMVVTKTYEDVSF